MTTPHNPREYRSHGEEIQAALEWRAEQDRLAALDQRIEDYRSAAERLLIQLVWVLIIGAIALMAFGLFRFAIQQAEAMPRYIEGFE